MAGLMAFIIVLNLFFGGSLFMRETPERTPSLNKDIAMDFEMLDSTGQDNGGFIKAMPDGHDPPIPPGKGGG